VADMGDFQRESSWSRQAVCVGKGAVFASIPITQGHASVQEASTALFEL
jgi:hypothetical protein